MTQPENPESEALETTLRLPVINSYFRGDARTSHADGEMVKWKSRWWAKLEVGSSEEGGSE